MMGNSAAAARARQWGITGRRLRSGRLEQNRKEPGTAYHPRLFFSGHRPLCDTQARTRSLQSEPQSSPLLILVGLSELDSNKYKAILKAKKQITQQVLHQTDFTVEDAPPCSDKVIDQFGEIATTRLKQLYRREFSEQDVGQMVAGYKSGMTTIELAKQFQCNKGTINKLLRQHGVRITKAKAQAKLNVDKVLSMYENMHTIEDIAKYFNVSSYTINRCLKAHGVKIRGRWDYDRTV